MNDTIWIKVTDVDLDVTNDCGDPIPDEDEKKKLESDVVGTLFEFHAEDEEFIHDLIDDRISDDCGWCVNYSSWEKTNA